MRLSRPSLKLNHSNWTTAQKAILATFIVAILVGSSLTVLNFTATNIQNNQPTNPTWQIYKNPLTNEYTAKEPNGNVFKTSLNALTVFNAVYQESTNSLGASMYPPALNVQVVVKAGNYGNTQIFIPSGSNLTLNAGVTGLTYYVGATANINDYSNNVFYVDGQIVSPARAQIVSDASDSARPLHIFTWINCLPSQINASMTNWLHQEHITDVGVTTQGVAMSQMQQESIILMNAGFTVWWVYSMWQVDDVSDISTYTTAQWVDRINGMLPQATMDRIYWDDMQWLNTTTAINNFLTAVVQTQTLNSYGESNQIVDSSTPLSSIASGINATGIDYDLYLPLTYNYTTTLSQCNGVLSLGGYIWGGTWMGSPSWQNCNMSEIAAQYQQMTNLGYTRITLWSGYQPDCYDGFIPASWDLYQNPKLWAFVAQQDANFLGI